MESVTLTRDGRAAAGTVQAVLGPTNTGKTHLAIERMCAHSSGIMGFPLRLLAREVYDRICRIKGPERVALITGEERIVPRDARWFCSTMESMPLSGGKAGGQQSGASLPSEFAFVGLDEVQLGADMERGHVFTDRLLHARGREETMLLGSETVRPLVEQLVPEADIVTRPRFSTLTYAGQSKLSRLPPRSAIVGFSAEQVYALAETLRRLRGGAAVVMGALSPRTRNAQVEMFQAGEVDYLVATDAIGMGLNMDVTHVAFASLTKYDGARQRRLSIPEMAQIAGRAGRHQKDGSFGTLLVGKDHGARGRSPEMDDEEVDAIENHRFRPLTKLNWRSSEVDMSSLGALIASLEETPDSPWLKPAPEAIDVRVLKALADEADIASTVRRPGDVARFWELCSLPDFRQMGPMHHGRFVARLWQAMCLHNGHLPLDFVASAIANLDMVQGDIDTLSGRIAAIRIWSYISQRAHWVLAAHEMAARARAVEDRLSDALHARLTERFVNRRTSVLLRKIGANAGELPVTVGEENVVSVDGEELGHLKGFRFIVSPDAKLADHRMLLAAAEKHLGGLLRERAETLVADPHTAFQLMEQDGTTYVMWQDDRIARLSPGRSLMKPEVSLERHLSQLDDASRPRVLARVEKWLVDAVERDMAPLQALEEMSLDPEASPGLRALSLQLIDAGGILPRDHVTDLLKPLDQAERKRLRKAGVIPGSFALFAHAMVNLRRQSFFAALARIKGVRPPRIPERFEPAIAADARGHFEAYRRFADQHVRVDCAEKVVQAAHKARIAADADKGAEGAKSLGFVLDSALARSMGIEEKSWEMLLGKAGFFRVPEKEIEAAKQAAQADAANVNVETATSAGNEEFASVAGQQEVPPVSEALPADSEGGQAGEAAQAAVETAAPQEAVRAEADAEASRAPQKDAAEQPDTGGAEQTPAPMAEPEPAVPAETAQPDQTETAETPGAEAAPADAAEPVVLWRWKGLRAPRPHDNRRHGGKPHGRKGDSAARGKPGRGGQQGGGKNGKPGGPKPHDARSGRGKPGGPPRGNQPNPDSPFADLAKLIKDNG